jgi:hypothetical protein
MHHVRVLHFEDGDWGAVPRDQFEFGVVLGYGSTIQEALQSMEDNYLKVNGVPMAYKWV